MIKRRWTAFALAGVLLLGGGMLFPREVRAESVVKEIEVETVKEDGTEKTYEEISEEMKKVARNIPIQTNLIANWPKGPKIYAESGIVMDMDTGAILYGKEIDEKHYPASITKIMTALVAVEEKKLTDTVFFSKESIDTLEPGYAHIAMKPGEEISMKDALHALLLASANEVAYAIGETVGGTHDHFVEMMNERAKELGCKNTHFVNTNGMFSEDHYTSARDMALIAREAFSHPEIVEIMQTLQYEIGPTNLEKEPRIFHQKHKMLLQGKYHDDRCFGGKTGYTDRARNTLVTGMECNGIRIAAVVLASRKDTFEDTKRICDYGLSQFTHVNIANELSPKEAKEVSQDAFVTLPKTVSFQDLQETTKNHERTYSYEGQVVGKTAVKKADMEEKLEEVAKEQKEEESSPMHTLYILFAVIAGIGLILFITLWIYVRRSRERKRRRRRMEQRRRRKRR